MYLYLALLDLWAKFGGHERKAAHSYDPSVFAPVPQTGQVPSLLTISRPKVCSRFSFQTSLIGLRPQVHFNRLA